jgi:hypothetical protein
MNGKKNISIYTSSEVDVGTYSIAIKGTIYDAYKLSIYSQINVISSVSVTNNCPTAAITTTVVTPCCAYVVGSTAVAMIFN